MFTATLWCDIRLGDVGSLKAKRSVVRPIVAELRRRYSVSAAEVGALDLHRRTEIGVAAVASTAAQVGDVLDSCERFVATRPDIELLAVRRQLLSHTDDPTDDRTAPTDDPTAPTDDPAREENSDG